jgi:hypothetical protein
MRRFLLATGLASLLAAGASAQIELRQDDGSTDFTSRGSLGGTALTGWAVQRNDTLGVNETTQWFTVMQDQNCSTLEIWRMALLGESVASPGTADETNIIADTGTFLSATNGATTACAWIYTITAGTPVAHGTAPTGTGIFTATYLPSNPLWVADGSSSHISIFNAGGTPEFPNGIIAAQYPPTIPGVGPGAVFGSEIVFGSGGGAATMSAGSWRIYNRNSINMAPATGTVGQPGGVAYDVRPGCVESLQSAGLYALTGVVAPDNFGMGGRYPDAINQTGTAPAREDDLVWRSNSPSFIGTGVEQVFLSSGTLRSFGSNPIDLVPNGRWELLVPDVLFSSSAALLPAQPVAATNVDHRLVFGLLGTGSIRDAFNAIPAGSGAVLDVYSQGLRLDLGGTGGYEISSCRNVHYEW